MNHLPQIIWPLGLTAIAIASIATALVELLKDLFPVRRAFQRNFLKRWFAERLAAKPNAGAIEFRKAEAELVRLATGGDRDAFYDLEPAQLCGQVNSAAQQVIAFPKRHSNLLRFLAPEADPNDVELLTSATNTTPGNAMTDPQELFDARNRVTHQLQRSVDALQISMSFRWKFFIQIIINFVCFILAFGVVLAVKTSSWFSVAEAIAVGLLAGFVSPLLSDLASFINQLRRP
jgi:hypothetical protein